MNFNIELASALVNSTELFPVDFNLAYFWLGYSRKDHGLDALKANFVVDVDFRLEFTPTNQSGGRPSNKYYLTLECFKSWGMMAGVVTSSRANNNLSLAHICKLLVLMRSASNT